MEVERERESITRNNIEQYLGFTLGFTLGLPEKEQEEEEKGNMDERLAKTKR